MVKVGLKKSPVLSSVLTFLYYHHSDFTNKQSHIASAACEFNGRETGKISRKSTLLIDDEAKNIDCALRESVHALWFNPLKPSS